MTTPTEARYIADIAEEAQWFDVAACIRSLVDQVEALQAERIAIIEAYQKAIDRAREAT